MGTSGKRPIVRQWLDLYDDSTPAERQAARGYVLAQRHPRRRRWWLFPRRSAWLPIIIGRETIIIGGEPPAAAPSRRSPLAARLGRVADLCFAAFGVGGLACTAMQAAIIVLLAMSLLYASNPIPGGAVLLAWAALLAYGGGQFMAVTRAAVRDLARA